ncbi:MAG: HDOD domain-containing protein [Fimbriimonas ginsengisoli]|uniref:HDOD domain-containing protein n=1 Tax=Fimbriimonas ginsengisoli TaxID=1005039 RepID=A0A931LTS6_FIMGI|nr:HDOD domain-containing protein [Fimbriimonas ginsengisoli]
MTIEKSLRDLPAMPQIVARVLHEMEQPEVPAAAIEKIIGTDQALTMKVLCVVNSAYYGLSGQVTSLSQAIVILGMHQVRNLVLSVGAISTIRPRTPRHHDLIRQFWTHSFGSATATLTIARDKNLPERDIETVFIGGLVHDVGRLFLYCNFTDIYDDLIAYADERQMAVEDVESTFLGMTHAQVGEEMAKGWKLPLILSTLIGRHEGPLEADDSPLLFCVHLGDRLTKHLYHSPECKVIPAPHPVAWDWLGYTTQQWEELKSGTAETVSGVAEQFQLLAA